jgi:NADH-quinone oxidoreductase subunit I
LVFDEKPDSLRCVACKICEDECPPKCIYIEVDRDPKTGKLLRRPRVFDIDYSVCMQCGICAEVCPFDAIKMDHDYELARADRFEGLLFTKPALAKSKEYYRKVRPAEAAVVDARLAKVKKPTPPAKPEPPKPAPPPAKPGVPAEAPLTPEQRAWLETYLKTAVAGAAVPAPPPAPPAAAAGVAPVTPGAPPADAPWHDPSLGMAERMKLAEGKPLPLRLMAAMAQLDCHACGYDCQGYAAAIAEGSETSLSLCVPGEKETEDALQELVKAAGKLPAG